MVDLPRLVCASANPDKVAEIALVLDGLVDLRPRPAGLGDVVEPAGASLELALAPCPISLRAGRLAFRSFALRYRPLLCRYPAGLYR